MDGPDGRGDPGRSKFYLSCEDDLLRIFATATELDAIMRTFGVEEGEAITHRWLNGAIATAQKRVEQRNFEIRKNLLKYDDVVNDQRKAVFEQRQEFMEASDLSVIVAEMRHDTIADLVARHVPPKAYADQWDIEGLEERTQALLGLTLPIKDWAAEEGIADEEIEERLLAAADARAAEREKVISPEQTRHIEKNFLLQMVDMHWREHLMHLDHLRNVIGLRGYGQRDPLNEYKTEAFSLFEKLIGDLRQSVTRWMMTVEIQFADPEPAPIPRYEVHIDPQTGENERVMEMAGASLHPPLLTSTTRAATAAHRPAGRLRAHRPQRPLPLRLRPQIQTLPRSPGLTPPGILRASPPPTRFPLLVSLAPRSGERLGEGLFCFLISEA